MVYLKIDMSKRYITNLLKRRFGIDVLNVEDKKVSKWGRDQIQKLNGLGQDLIIMQAR